MRSTSYELTCRDCGQRFYSATRDLSHCDDCRATRSISDPVQIQRAALLIGALILHNGPAKASDLRRLLGGNVWGWMLDELVECGVAVVDRSDQRPGWQRYALIGGQLNETTRQLRADIERGQAYRPFAILPER